MAFWDRQKDESHHAYHAFSVYRDLGPGRSHDNAWRKLTRRKRGGAPGAWARWSTKHTWVERVAAYDAQEDQKARAVREARRLQLVERRADHEFDVQEKLEKLEGLLWGALEKHATAPVTDVESKEDNIIAQEDGKIVTVKTTTRVKAIKTAGMARLSQEYRAAMVQAIVGPRSGTEEAPAQLKMPDFVIETLADVEPPAR